MKRKSPSPSTSKLEDLESFRFHSFALRGNGSHRSRERDGIVAYRTLNIIHFTRARLALVAVLFRCFFFSTSFSLFCSSLLLLLLKTIIVFANRVFI